MSRLFLKSCFSPRAAISMTTLFAAALGGTDLYAAIMHSDVSIQTYTDFGQNTGFYSTTSNALLDYIREQQGGIVISYTGGQDSYVLEHGLINYESVGDIGAYNAIGNNFIATVAHNGVQNPTFTARYLGDSNAIHYATIEYRYSYLLSGDECTFSLKPTNDYKIARTSKLITDVSGTSVYSGTVSNEALAGELLYRAGSGTMKVADYDGNFTWVSGAYAYIIGGIVTIGSVTSNTDNSADFRGNTDDSFSVGWWFSDWSSNSISDTLPMPVITLAGDSGSPAWVWNEETQQYEYLAALQSGHSSFSQLRGATEWTLETMESYNKHVDLTSAVGVITINAVTDVREDETITCDIQGVSATPVYGTVTDSEGTQLAEFIGVQSGLNTWHSLSALKDTQNWYAYGNSYLNSAIDYADLFLTENLVFAAAQEETVVNIGADVDLGIGYLEFTAGELEHAKFTVSSDDNHMLNSAGYVVGENVDLYITISNTDADYIREWRKTGEGNLHIAGTGNNEIFLNVGGDGVTYLEQTGGYAAYNVLANNGSTVVINDVNQIARDFTFGAGGGVLDMNGHSMEWRTTHDAVTVSVANDDGTTTATTDYSSSVAKDGFTINALTEDAVITNTASTAVTLTYTESGDTTFLGSFKDTTDGGLKIVYDGGAESSWTLHSIFTDLSNNAESGFEVASGKVTLSGTNTVHAVGSATGTSQTRYTNEDDWHYADATMNVSVASGATFELGSHARVTGDVSVASGGTFVMNEGVKHRYEYVEGWYYLVDTDDFSDFFGLKGDVSLEDGAEMRVEYSAGTDANTTYAGNITGAGNMVLDLGTDGGSLTLAGENTFTGTKTLTSGGLIAENDAALGDVSENKWLVGEKAYLANRSDNADLLQFVDESSTGVLALTADRTEQIDLSSHSGLIIGALEGCVVNYGVAEETLASYDGKYVLGGGGGNLVVNFKLTGETELVLGNAYTRGTVTLTNAENDFSGGITFAGAVDLVITSAGALGDNTLTIGYEDTLLPETGITSNLLEKIDAASTGTLFIDNSADAAIDLSALPELSLGASENMTFTGTVTVADGEAYRFGGSSSALVLNTELDAGHDLVIDGHGTTGGAVALAQAVALDGAVSVIGYDSEKTSETAGSVTLTFMVNNALANASSVTVTNGGIIDLLGTNQTFKELTTTATGTVIDSTLSKTLTVESGRLSGTVVVAHLEKIGSGKLTIGENVKAALIDVTEGTLSLSFSSTFSSSGLMNLSDGTTVNLNSSTIAGTVNVVNNGTATLSGRGWVSGTIGAEAGSTLVLSGGLLTLTGSSINASGGTLSLQNSQLTIGAAETVSIGGTLSVENDATLLSERPADNSIRNINRINVAKDSTLTIDEASWNTVWNLGALTGEGNVTWLSDTTHWYSSRVVISGEGDLSGAFTFNRAYQTATRPYQAFLELANDKALANASSVNLNGQSNSYASLAINSDNVHLNGLNGNAYAHLYAGASIEGEASSSHELFLTAPASTRDATLTLTGSGEYTYAGTVAGSTDYALSLVKEGTGTQTFSGEAYFNNVSAAAGTLTLSNATIAGDLAVGQGATLNFNDGAGVFTLSDGKTFSVLGSEDGGTATFNGSLVLDGGTLSFSGRNLSESVAALSVSAFSVGENHESTAITLTDLSNLAVGKTYLLSDEDWSAISVTMTESSESYLGATIIADADGLKLTVTATDGFVVWNGTSEKTTWSSSEFAQHSALSETDVAVFADSAESKNVVLAADATVAGVLFDNSEAYTVSGEDYTISAGYLTAQGGGTAEISADVEISGDLTVTSGSTLALNGTTNVAGKTQLEQGATLAGAGTLTTYQLGFGTGDDSATFDGISVNVTSTATRFTGQSGFTKTFNFVNDATLDDRNSYYAITGTLNLAGGENSGGTIYVNGLRLSDGGDVQSNLNVGENVHLIITGTAAGQAGSFSLSHWGAGLRNSGAVNALNISGKLTSSAVISSWDTPANINVQNGGELNLLAGLSRNTGRDFTIAVNVGDGARLNAAGGTQSDSLSVNLKAGSTLGAIADEKGGTATFTNNFTLGTSGVGGTVTVDTDVSTASDFLLTQGKGGNVVLDGTVTGVGSTKLGVAGSGTLTLSGTVDVAGISVASGATLDLEGTVVISDFASTLIANAGTVTLGDGMKFALSGADSVLASGITVKLFDNVDGAVISRDVERSDFTWNGNSIGGRSEFSYDADAGTVYLAGISAYNLTWAGGTEGTWDIGTTQNWTVDGTEGEISAFYAYDNVTLATADAQITLTEGEIRPGTLTVTQSATLTGGENSVFVADSVTIASEQTLTLGGEGTFSLSSVSGEGALAKTGAGTLTLVSSNSYTGGTTVSEGKLVAAAEGAIGTGTATVTDSGTLELAYEGAFANTLSGDGTVSVNSTGTITASGDISAFTGTLSVDAGTFAVAASAIASTSAGSAPSAENIVIAEGATLEASGTYGDVNSTLYFSGLSGNGTLNVALNTANGQGINAENFSGTLYVRDSSRLQLTATTLGENALIEFEDGSDMVFNAAMSSFANDMKIDGTSEVYFNSSSSGTVELSGDISGEGTLQIAGNNNTRTLTLSGNVDLGGITIQTSFGTKTVTVAGANANIGTLTQASGVANFTGTATVANIVHTGGSITVGSAGSLTLSENISLSSAISNSGTVSVVVDSVVFELANLTATDGAYTLISGGTIENWSSLTVANFTLSGVEISERSGLSVSTAGVVTLLNDGAAGSLVWTGSQSQVWDVKTTENWTNSSTSASDIFYNNDNVTFATADVTVAIDGAVVAGNVTVTEDTTFTANTSDAAFSQSTGATIEVAEGKNAVFDRTVSTSGSVTKTGAGRLVMAADASTTISSAEISEGTFALSVDASGAVEFSGTVSGAGVFEKTGAGTLTLTAENSYTGGTEVSEGKLVAASEGVLGEGDVSVASGAKLAVSHEGTFDKTVAGEGVLEKTGEGTLTLAVENSHTGGTEVSEGTLVAATEGALGEGEVSVASGAKLEVAHEGTLDNTISGEGSLEKTGEGTLTVSGDNTHTGGTTVSEGTLVATKATVFGKGTLAVAHDSMVRIVCSGAMENVITGSGAVWVETDEEFALNGDTDAFGGTIGFRRGKTSAKGTFKSAYGVIVESAAVLAFSDTLSGISASNVSGEGTVQLAFTQAYVNTLNLGANFTGTTYVTAGAFSANDLAFGNTLRLADGVNFSITEGSTVSLSNNFVFDGATTSVQNSGASLTFDSASSVSGGSYTSSGSGTVNFEGSVDLDTFTQDEETVSNFAGTTTLSAMAVSAGTVNFTAGTATIETATLTGGTVNILGGDVSISSLALSASGALTVSGEDTEVAFTGANLYGTTTVSDGAVLDLTSNASTGTWSDGYRGEGVLIIDGGTVKMSNLQWGASGNFGANMTNDRVQILNGGVWEITAAQAEDAGAQRGFSVTEGTGTYRYSGSGTNYISANDANQSIHIADGATLVFDVVESDAELVVSKVIGNGFNADSMSETSGSVEKTGAGTLILSGTNLYTGGTTISAGTLSVTNASALGSGAVDIASGTLLDLNFAGTYSASSLTGTGTVNIGSEATLNANFEGTFANAVSGDGVLVLDSTGTLVVSGANGSFTGDFVVNSGTVVLGSTTALGSTDSSGVNVNISVNSGATLDLNGQTKDGWYGNYTLNGGTLENNGTAMGRDSRQLAGGITLTANSEVSGTSDFGLVSSAYAANTLTLNGYTLTKTGTNTFWLTNTTVSEGTFEIAEGTVNVANYSVDASAADFVLSGGTLSINQTFSAKTISGESGALSVTSGTTTVSDAVNFTGTTTISGGTLNISCTEESTLGATTISGGTLNVAQNLAVETLSGNSGTLSLASGTTTVGGAVDFTGATTISGGTLNVSAGGTLGNITFNGSGGAVNFSKATDADSAEYTVGTILTDSSNNYARNLTIDEGVSVSATTFENKWGMGVATVNGELDIEGTLLFSTGRNGSTETNVLTGTGTVSAQGLSLGNIGTYNISVNRLELGADGISGNGDAFNLGATTVVATESWSTASTTTNIALVSEDVGTTFELGENITATLGGTLSGAGILNKTGTGTLTLSGTNTYTGGTAVSAGKLVAANASALGTGAASVADGANLELAFDGSFSNTLTGAGTLNVNSTGTVVSAGDISAFTGNVSIDAGTFGITTGDSTALANAENVFIAEDATLKYSGFSGVVDFSLDSNISGTGTVELALTSQWSNTFNASAENFSGTTYISSGYFTVNNAVFGDTLHLAGGVNFQLTGGTTVTFSNNLVLDGSTEVHQNSGATLTFDENSTVTGAGTYVRKGGGTLTFNGAVDLGGFSQGVNVTTNFAGTTELDTLTVSSGTVNFTSGEATVNALTFNGSGGAVNFTKASDADSAEYALGTILTDSSNSYTRSLTIDEGVSVSATTFENKWGMGAATVNGKLDIEGTLLFSTGRNASTETNVLTGTGTVSAQGLSLGNVGTYNISVNRLELGAGGISGNGDALNLGATTVVATESWSTASDDTNIALVSSDEGTMFEMQNASGEATSATLAGTLSGTGMLIKSGSGTLALQAENSYSGGTLVSEGRLVAANASALGTGTAVVNNGGELQISALNATVSGGIYLESGAKIVVDLADFSDSISGDEVTLTILAGTTITFGGDATRIGYTLLRSSTNETDYYVTEDSSGDLSVKYVNREFSYDESSGTLTLTLSVPEPSMFGLLAGLGALALTVSRRRRKA